MPASRSAHSPVHCGPGGIFLMDHENFEVRGQWEMDRGPQQLSYDVWWHLGHDTLITSEWGTPDTFENGLVPEILLGAETQALVAHAVATTARDPLELPGGRGELAAFRLEEALREPVP